MNFNGYPDPQAAISLRGSDSPEERKSLNESLKDFHSTKVLRSAADLGRCEERR